MKLSEQTVNILRNFSTINQNILVKSGSQLQTMSTMKNILGTAAVPETFPRDFGQQFWKHYTSCCCNCRLEAYKEVLGVEEPLN